MLGNAWGWRVAWQPPTPSRLLLLPLVASTSHHTPLAAHQYRVQPWGLFTTTVSIRPALLYSSMLCTVYQSPGMLASTTCMWGAAAHTPGPVSPG
jgi:hypothetical protein